MARTADKPMLFGLMGHPVSHSRSPVIHDLFAEQMGIALRYELYDVTPGEFPEAVRDFIEEGGHGLNITVPHKLAAYEMSDEVSDRARMARSVNTIRIDQGRLISDNTDGAGLIRDLTVNNAHSIAGNRILIIGAGGAVQGVLGPLLSEGASSIVIVNRTPDRAVALAEHFRAHGDVTGCGFEDLDTKPCDLVIHATSAGLEGNTPPVPEGVVGKDTLCYDMFYAPCPTPFTIWAESAGAGRILQGWGMLIEQAAESFFFWHGQRPETLSIIEELVG